jgi:ornithine cyclodeaminase
MQYLDAETIRARLPWPVMLAALDEALRADVHAPLRASHGIEVPGMPPATLLMMPAWRSGRSIGVKLVTVFPGNADRGKRSVSALYALFDAHDGVPLALLDGEELTARRTAGASAYAASRLARRDARALVVVGAGRIGQALVDAHLSIRPLEHISIWSRTAARRSRGRRRGCRHRFLRHAVDSPAGAGPVAQARRPSRPGRCIPEGHAGNRRGGA